MPVALSTAQVQAVAKKRILFAHQSVGSDITEGLQKIAESHGVQLHVAESATLPSEGTGFYHFKVGRNGDPKGKLAEFVTTAGDPNAAAADVAMVKLCYIDFSEDTDAKTLAQEYIAAVDEVRKSRPQTRVVAMTSPLTTIQTGPKAWLKRILGKDPAGYRVNARRQVFNDELRKHFDDGSLFDIAQIESSGTELQRFEFEGREVQALNPAYTYDGGHLNDAGKQAVASALLAFLARS